MRFDPITLARLYGAKLARKSCCGRWYCDDMKGTPLDTLTFDTIKRAAEAYLIHGKMDTRELRASDQDGYATGRSWKETYRPGGPFQWSARLGNGSWEQRMSAFGSQARHKAWMAGFDRGLAALKKSRAKPQKPLDKPAPSVR